MRAYIVAKNLLGHHLRGDCIHRSLGKSALGRRIGGQTLSAEKRSDPVSMNVAVGNLAVHKKPTPTLVNIDHFFIREQNRWLVRQLGNKGRDVFARLDHTRSISQPRSS
jgi:hypothetical protein